MAGVKFFIFFIGFIFTFGWKGRNINFNIIEITKSNKININEASIEELETLTGIGKSKAEAIIEYRKKSKFKTIDEIMNVTGIGESLFASIREKITI